MDPITPPPWRRIHRGAGAAAAAPAPPSAQPAVEPAATEELSRRADQLAGAYEHLRDELAHYQALFEFAPDPCLVTNGRGIIEEANHAAAEFLDIPAHLLLGKPLPFLVAVEDRPDFYLGLGNLCRFGEPPPDWEVRFQPRRGPARRFSVTVQATPGDDGRPEQLRWLLRDVTERTMAEARLLVEKEFSLGLVETAEALVLVLDRGGIVRRVNAFAELISGQSRTELLGWPWWDVLVAEPDRRRVCDDFSRSLAASGRFRAIYGLTGPGGVPRVVQWSGRPLGGAGAAAPAFLVVGHDITELQQAQQQALRAERLATIGQMAAGLAHESRNALQRSQACLALLRWQCQDRPQALDLIGRLEKAQSDLHRLYEDVREYAAPIQLECRRCDLSEVWREVWGHVTSLYTGRKAQLQEAADGTDLRLCADPFRLAGVFRNVLENALEACGETVRVRIECRDDTLHGRAALRVAVRDNGPGLAPEQRQRLFEPLYTTKTRGSGLGMAIVKRIVEAHGGEVAAGNAPGGGAEIVLTLPRSQP
jgi:PAS domain S-box-containing protein